MNKFSTVLIFSFLFAYSVVSKSDEGFEINFSQTSAAVQKSARSVGMLILGLPESAPKVGSFVFIRFADESRKFGYFLTAHHVVKQCQKGGPCESISAAFNGVFLTKSYSGRNLLGESLKSHFFSTGDIELMAADPTSDLAIFKAPLSRKLGLEEPQFADSVVEGDPVYAVGYPSGDLLKQRDRQKDWLGSRRTFSRGIVVAPKQWMTSPALGGVRREMLVTNADTIPGNSGGGIFNEKGELIGVASSVFSGNIKKYSLSETRWQAGSFAAPVSSIKTLMASMGLK